MALSPLGLIRFIFNFKVQSPALLSMQIYCIFKITIHRHCTVALLCISTRIRYGYKVKFWNILTFVMYYLTLFSIGRSNFRVLLSRWPIELFRTWQDIEGILCHMVQNVRNNAALFRTIDVQKWEKSSVLFISPEIVTYCLPSLYVSYIHTSTDNSYSTIKHFLLRNNWYKVFFQDTVYGIVEPFATVTNWKTWYHFPNYI